MLLWLFVLPGPHRDVCMLPGTSRSSRAAPRRFGPTTSPRGSPWGCSARGPTTGPRGAVEATTGWAGGGPLTGCGVAAMEVGGGSGGGGGRCCPHVALRRSSGYDALLSVSRPCMLHRHLLDCIHEFAVVENTLSCVQVDRMVAMVTAAPPSRVQRATVFTCGASLTGPQRRTSTM